MYGDGSSTEAVQALSQPSLYVPNGSLNLPCLSEMKEKIMQYESRVPTPPSAPLSLSRPRSRRRYSSSDL